MPNGSLDNLAPPSAGAASLKTFHISGPDGAEYEIDAPAEEAALKAFQSLGAAKDAPGVAPAPVPSQTQQLAAAKAATAAPYIEGGLPDMPSAEELQRQGAGVPTGLYAAASGAMESDPVVGPMLTGASNRTAALLRSIRDGTSYSDELARVQGYDEGARAAHPTASTVGGVVGGVAGLAPAMVAAPEIFGAAAAPPLARMLASTVSGGLIGAGDAAVRTGGDLNEIERGGMTGVALGFGAPVLGAAAGYGARKAGEAVASRFAPSTGFSPAATRVLSEDVANSGGVAPIRARLGELGQDSMLLDASPSFQGQAQGLAVRPETREAVVAPVMARTAGTSARLDQDVNGALGPARSPQAITVDLRGQRMEPNQAIGAAVDGAQAPVSAHPVLQMIDGRLQTARGGEETVLRRARDMLAHTDPETGWTTIADDPRILHNVKSEMDRVIAYGDPGLGVAPGAQTRKDSAAQAVRGHLNGLLRDGVPGYGAANDASAALARQIEATQRGSELLRSGETATAPMDLARQLLGMPPAEREAMAGATRGVIDRAVGTKPNDLTALQSLLQVDPRSGQGGWNAQNLAQLHGQEPIDRIVGAVNRERAFTDADTNIARNSQTSQRQQAADRIAPRSTLGDDFGGTVAGAVGGPKGWLLAQGGRLAKAGINAAGQAADVARNRELAQAVTMQPGDMMDQFLNAIGMRAAMQQRAVAAGRAAQIGTQAATVSQADRTRPYFPTALPGFR